MQHTLIFDIGKTNKKVFVFDENYKVVFKAYTRFETIPDEDDFPSDDLEAIVEWIEGTFDKLAASKKYNIQKVNFSTYGASLVHLAEDGKPLTPLYNYLKPYPKKCLKDFYKRCGKKWRIAQQTSSPPSGMLNSGLQLYWLKHSRPDLFKQIKWSLHFPQYLSYLFTGIPVSDPTSIGCHTSLWNYKKEDYHDWVYQEGVNKVLAPIVPTDTAVVMKHKGRKLKIGIGVHDSSSALLPYLLGEKKPFLLLSTGTWSVALNPFNPELLSKTDLQNGVLNYRRIDGKAVKAVRLFLGNEYQVQVEQLAKVFKKGKNHHKKVKFDTSLNSRLKKKSQRHFHLESIGMDENNPKQTNWPAFKNYKEAYHQLMRELVDLQAEAVNNAIGNTSIKKIIIDGGFVDNDLFVQLLKLEFPQYKIQTSNSSNGTALGAAMLVSNIEHD